MEASFDPENSRGIMDEDGQQSGGSLSSSASGLSADSGSSSNVSDFAEDADSSASGASMSSSSSSSLDPPNSGPRFQISSLMEQLPFKRGLSKYFHGKSQTFTSLSNVRCLEDLAKPENPYKKKLKSCKSYGGELDSHHRSFSPRASSRIISKRALKGSCFSFSSKTNSFLCSKPPVPRRRAAALSDQNLLFA